MHRTTKNQGERGSCLLSAMMAIAIGCVIVTAIMTTLNSSLKRMSAITELADVRDMRLFLAMATDCNKTKTLYRTCNGDSIGLRDQNNASVVRPYVPGQATQIGRYQVRAMCKGRQVVVEYARPKETWASLYTPKAPFSCRY